MYMSRVKIKYKRDWEAKAKTKALRHFEVDSVLNNFHNMTPDSCVDRSRWAGIVLMVFNQNISVNFPSTFQKRGPGDNSHALLINIETTADSKQTIEILNSDIFPSWFDNNKIHWTEFLPHIF